MRFSAKARQVLDNLELTSARGHFEIIENVQSTVGVIFAIEPFLMSDFNAKFPVHIRFSDFDSLGHVNNAVYLTYLEEARVKYFETVIEHHKEIDWWEHGIILANIGIDFRKPIDGYFDYYISIRCSRIGTKSFDFTYLITHEENGVVEINAKASTVMVCYDYEKQATVPVYDNWIEKMEKFEGRPLRVS